MWQLILRGLGAGFIVVAISEIAGRFPRLGALVLTVPVVPAAVLLLLYLKHNNVAPVAVLSREMLILIALCLPFFLPLALAQRLHVSFWTAYIAGVALMLTSVTAYLLLASRSA